MFTKKFQIDNHARAYV